METTTESFVTRSIEAMVQLLEKGELTDIDSLISMLKLRQAPEQSQLEDLQRRVQALEMTAAAGAKIPRFSDLSRAGG